MWNQQTSSHSPNNAVSLARTGLICAGCCIAALAGPLMPPPPAPLVLLSCSKQRFWLFAARIKPIKHARAGRAVTSRPGREAVYLRGANEGTSPERSCVNGMVGSSPPATESAGGINGADRLVPGPSELLSRLFPFDSAQRWILLNQADRKGQTGNKHPPPTPPRLPVISAWSPVGVCGQHR